MRRKERGGGRQEMNEIKRKKKGRGKEERGERQEQ